MHNLVSAAAATGVNRSTILRAIKAGRISAQRDETNGWQIDPAEPPSRLSALAERRNDSNATWRNDRCPGRRATRGDRRLAARS
jgi:GH24 family phage-related lysozyme (muramidase)